MIQITCFVSLIALDVARQESNRFDVFCCLRGSKKDQVCFKKINLKKNCENDKKKFELFFQNNQEGMLYKLFKYLYAPFLMKKWVRYVKKNTFYKIS